MHYSYFAGFLVSHWDGPSGVTLEAGILKAFSRIHTVRRFEEG
ncbi:hypothetical protein MRB53_028210 [Persea americana]|uniref:Uncharacterized protein n=1 Tax=Persea americana TaxID=3435 RepID=A0ACC2KF26_PERAE|nr:hypothetical protein MRB53_028210 [Persea americana]